MFQLYEVRVISKALKVYLGTYYGKCLAIEQKIKDNQKAGLPTLELENNLKVAQDNLKEDKGHKTKSHKHT